MSTIPQSSSIEHFTNGDFAIELLPVGDSFRAIAPGVARGLGHRDAANMLGNVPDEEKGYTLVSTPGGHQQVWYITEPGLYRVIGQRQAARIKNPTIREQVESFQRWIFHDVLPALRKHGRYALPGGDQVHGSLPTTLTWDAAAAIGRAHHGLGMESAEWKRVLTSGGILKLTGAPRRKYEDLFWPTDTRWEIHAHSVQYLVGVALVTVRRMQTAANNVQMLLELDAIGREFPGLDGGAA
jgi:prophage antirepressor-like protein